MPSTPRRITQLLAGLNAARDGFMAAVADVDPALRTTPGLVGELSVRELVAHVGYWAGHAGEALHRAAQGELTAFGRDELSVDERNAVVARVAAQTDFATATAREQAAFEAFAAALALVDPEWLGERDADGDTLEEIIAFDGADHYREHMLDIRSWFSGAAEPDEADDDAPDPEADGD